MSRLEFSKVELCDGDIDFKVRQLKDDYLFKIFDFSNQLGLRGKKIKRIVKVEESFSDRIYIDFICEEP